MRLDDVARDAELLDALAEGLATDDPTVELLAALRLPPARTTARRAKRRLGRLGVLAAATLLSSGIGVAAAATTSHPGDLLYPVHRVVLGRTADDPAPVAHLLDQAQAVVDHAPKAAPLDPDARTHALALVTQAQSRLPALKVRDATPLAHRAELLRATFTMPATPTVKHHHRHHHRHVVTPTATATVAPRR